MTKSKWRDFRRGKGYRLQDLGRPARFVIPVGKLGFPYDRQCNVREHIEKFLTENFGAYTTSVIPQFGAWTDARGQIIDDEVREFKVSFLGKGRIRDLLEELGQIAIAIGEECIYVEAGQYAALVYPHKTQKQRNRRTKGHRTV